jgi:hypothetical protein
MFDELARIMLADYQRDLLRWIGITSRIEGGLGSWHPLTDALARVLTAQRIKGALPVDETMETLRVAFNVIEEYSDRFYERELQKLTRSLAAA